jgi:hypothetical protein
VAALQSRAWPADWPDAVRDAEMTTRHPCGGQSASRRRRMNDGGHLNLPFVGCHSVRRLYLGSGRPGVQRGARALFMRRARPAAAHQDRQLALTTHRSPSVGSEAARRQGRIPHAPYLRSGRSWAPAVGHEPSLPTRSKILPQRAYEWQVYGGEFEPLFGPTRPGADTGISFRNQPLDAVPMAFGQEL